MIQPKKFHQKLGTALMISAVILLLYIYTPIIRIYFFTPPTPLQNVAVAQDSESYWIEIPKIKAAAPIVKNVDPWNESEYKDSLRHGIAHAKGTALPGQKGTYLFAHSSDYPWNITQYNTAFFKLHQLQIKDEITITNGDKKYTYKVIEIKEVWPSEVQYLKKPNADLILQTCTPVGTDLRRLLVFAELQ